MEKIRKHHPFVSRFKQEVSKVIVGQEHLINFMLLALLSDGHILLEGVPGIAKTQTAKTVANISEAEFKRVQFTPDLMPSDITGLEIYDRQKGTWSTKKGPIFSNIFLADEINRSPAKVQSALLESMGERQVTIGDTTHRLPAVWLVIATQNPIEQEGTYPLPEAQKDRFLFHVVVSYPATEEEDIEITLRNETDETPQVERVITLDELLQTRKVVQQIHVSKNLRHYITRIVRATRPGNAFVDLKGKVQMGASPRANIYITKAAKAHAFLEGRAYVIPEDIHAVAHDILRHRIIMNYSAESKDIHSDTVIDQILKTIPVPE
ncbi:MAG: MoxR family ATPase [Elusimicrobia bacterium]|nr:MoxR family ATPase [Elusimicrobiota bacterium]